VDAVDCVLQKLGNVGLLVFGAEKVCTEQEKRREKVRRQ
jgi:hypothetical protein